MTDKEQQPDPAPTQTDPSEDDDVKDDEVDQDSKESFPASDPPAW